MGTETGIQWCDHTFNPWRGCTKVSAGCAHCYAEKLSLRNPDVLGEWGVKGKRAIAAESYWKLPYAWDKKANADNVRRSVFCASLADVFEERAELDDHRLRLFNIIKQTQNLDWLLLTKRPVFAERWLQVYGLVMPENVWMGTSAENQETADERIPVLLSIPATRHFVSCEPLLGEVDLMPYFSGSKFQHDATYAYGGLDWVIVGGESGAEARPMKADWVRSLRDQCEKMSVAFFFKQWGEYHPKLGRVGKKSAGRMIDGQEWNDVFYLT